MGKTTLGLDSELYEYLLSVSVREPEILAKLRQETAKLPGNVMQISPDQGQFMALLVQLIGAKKTIEVGVYTGYSSLAVALALPPDGKIIACDIDEKSAAIARKYWQAAGVSNKIDLRLAPALDTLDKLIEEGQTNSFDFAFIDADKRNYSNYYKRCLQLIRPYGAIAIDNVLWSGSVADPEATDKRTIAIRKFNLRLHQDKRVKISMLPVADGLTLAMKQE